MGLKITDLVGKMEEVEILEFSQSEKEGKQICVLKVKSNEGKMFDVGLFGCAEEVLEDHGKTKSGKNILEIPASKIKEDGMVWINGIY